MVTSNKDAAKIWAEVEKARNIKPEEKRGPNDLEQRIEDLERIEAVHRKLNGELRKEIYELKLKAAKADEYTITIEQMKSFISDLTRDNNRMRKNETSTTEILREFRNKGDV
tara:strand:+ start:304 stop:639 length:336 start_codon:yes stop_codon:yes gene_type:complete